LVLVSSHIGILSCPVLVSSGLCHLVLVSHLSCHCLVFVKSWFGVSHLGLVFVSFWFGVCLILVWCLSHPGLDFDKFYQDKK
jgi:hypothetical protein